MSDVTYKSPLYIQLREVIRSKIEEGEYPPGTAIPSESQLAETYGLNRLSVRSALSALEYEGILTSVQGKGVFVNGAKTERDLDTLGGYRHTMSEKSKDPSTRVLIKALRKAGPFYSQVLKLDPQDDIWFIRRIDSSNGEPVALEEIYIPYAILPDLADADIHLFSIYDLYLWNGIQPETGQQVLRITKLEPAAAKLIGLNAGQAVMEFSCITRDTHGRIIEFARNYIRGDKTEFTVHYTNQKLV